MAEEEIKIFVSGSCGPCQQVKAAVAAGKFNASKVDLIDVETDEGFPNIAKFGLTKVPTAMKDGKTCNLALDGDILIIDCGEEVDGHPQ